MDLSLRFLVAAALCLCGSAWAQDTVEKPATVISGVVKVSAIVESADPATREIRLIGPKNERFTVVADDRVLNFEQLAPRDRVVIEYVESLGIMVSPPGSTTVNTEDVSEITVSPGEDRRSVHGVDVLVLTATVAELNRKTRMVTLVTPDGGVRTIRASEAVALDAVDVGDQVTVRATQTIAVSVVEPPG